MISFIKRNKILSILCIMTIITILLGFIFYAKLDEESRGIVSNNIIKLTEENTQNVVTFLSNNFISISIIWILGISMIGLPIIMGIYLYMVFVFSFECCALLSIKGISSLPFITIYLLPKLIMVPSIFLLCLYSIHFSLYLFQNLFLQKELNIKKMMKQYKKIYIITLIGLFLATCIEYMNYKYIFQLFH